MKNLFITKSSECRSDVFKGHASGIHLLLINSETLNSSHLQRHSTRISVFFPLTSDNFHDII